MSLAFHAQHTLPAALSLLPVEIDTSPARVLLLAIGLQESGFTHRLQLGGPARGFWQFEKGGGVAGVLGHARTAAHATAVCKALNYPATSIVVYQALADNDVLACAFARLLLWTLPAALPTTPAASWEQYLKAWRPSQPRRETWTGYYQRALSAVEAA